MKIRALTLVLAATAVTACGSSDMATGDSVESVRSTLARDAAPSLSAAEVEALEAGQADFAMAMYKAVAASPDGLGKDIFLSPHSISIALGMTYAGARGDTAAEMRTALHLALPDDRVHVGFDYLDLALSSRGKNAAGQDGRPFRLNIASSLWGQKGFAFEAPFLDTLAVAYGSGLNVLDFKGATEKSRTTINGWVEGKTEDRIKDLLPSGSLSADTRLVLVNAVYFNAAWQSKFEPTATAQLPFTKLDGTKASVAMMQATKSYGYTKAASYEAVALPYDGNELDLLVIAPTTGNFATFESGLTGGTLLGIYADLKPQGVRLAFPKHKLEASFELKAALQSLGMTKAFDGGDLTGISTSEPLQIGKVFHKTFLSVDEAGTEAAAATAVTIERATAALDAVPMTVDRPFIEAIVDRQTKTLVFVGRILDPKSP